MASKLPASMYCVSIQSSFFFLILLILYLVTPNMNCRLKMLKLNRVNDFLLMEEEYILNHEISKPQKTNEEVNVI